MSTVQPTEPHLHIWRTTLVSIILLMLITPFNIFSTEQEPIRPVKPSRRPHTSATENPAAVAPDSIPLNGPIKTPSVVIEDKFSVDTLSGQIRTTPLDTFAIEPMVPLDSLFYDGVVTDSIKTSQKRVFVPDPTRAVWLSALFPGLGQIYNRRYWKLPIVIGGFMGLGYGASWNNDMLTDYTRAYYDLMDNDPSTKSYMDFFPPNTDEDSLNRTWLERTLKSRKNYFRRNRDLCIIGMIGVYLLAVVDAYVDASLTNFDINPDLSMQFYPALLPDVGSPYPALGLQWAINF